MTRRIALLGFVLLNLAVFAEKKKEPSQTELAAISVRGRMMDEYDVAALHATDAVRALVADKDLPRGNYVARKNDRGWVVVFGQLNENHDKYLIFYEAVQGATPVDFDVKKYDPPLEDSDFYLRSATALRSALTDFEAEQRPYNTYVLPQDTGQLYVYILPAPTKAGVYPLGGDGRYMISSDGNKIIEKHRMHSSILEFDTSAKTGKIVMGVHAHVLTDRPEDSDVFYVLSRKPSMPEVVVTGEHEMYLVLTDGSIERRKR